MRALAIMHRRTLCENVNGAKIKVPFYTTDIDILRVASIHRIDILIHIDESLHPYSVPAKAINVTLLADTTEMNDKYRKSLRKS